MSTSQIGFTMSFPTGQSFASLQYTPVAINSSGQIVSATAAYNIIGIIQDTPDNSTDTVGGVTIFGKTRAVLSGTVTVGEQLQVGTSGTSLVALSSGIAVATALEAGASGDTVAVLLTPNNGAYAA
jgi:hypothetical protein